MTWNRLRSFRTSITARLLLLAFAPMVCAVLVASVGQYLRARSDAKAEIEERSALLTDVLAEAVPYAIERGNIESLRRTAQGLMAHESALLEVRVIHNAGTLIDVRRDFAGARHLHVVHRHIAAPSSPAAAPIVQADDSLAPASCEIVVTMSGDELLERSVRHLWYSALIVFAGVDVGLLFGIVFFARLRDPLQRVLRDVRAIQAGEWVDRPPMRLATGEMGELQTALHQMGTAVMLKKAELTGQVDSQLRALHVQTRELAMARDRALQSDREKRRLIQQSNAAIEAERGELALEMHDYLNLHLMPILLSARRLQGAAVGDWSVPVDTKAATATLVTNATALFDIFRAIIKRLRPESIDVIGLQGSLRGLLRSFLELKPETEWTIETSPAFPHLSGGRAMAAYRIVQEALLNVVKHAKAGHVIVRLACDTDGTLIIQVVDDGVGFDPELHAEGIGLIGMRERAVAEGATLDVQSVVHVGTRVVLTMPPAFEIHE